MIPVAHPEAHRLFLQGFLIFGIEANHSIHQGAMIGSGLVVYLLFQAAKRAEGLDTAIDQIELSLGDISGVIRHWVGHVVTGHRGHRQDGD